jgi:hypothetical protein
MSYWRNFVKCKVGKDATLRCDNAVWGALNDGLKPFVGESVWVRRGVLGNGYEVVKQSASDNVLGRPFETVAELYQVSAK